MSTMSSLSPASALAPTQAKKPPKSILKKPSAKATPRAPSTTSTTTTSTTTPKLDLDAPVPAAFQITEHTPLSEKKPTARDLAVQQALVIQAQRDREDQIQDTLIELSRLPLAPSTSSSSSPTPKYTAANPSPSDKTRFLTSIRLFQPSEYEDLITERNSLNKCGYCLCPSPRAKMGHGGAFKLLNYGRADFTIVPRAELERWCSRQCARRAMYVKVQLVENAAAPVESIRIDLLEEEEDNAKARAGTKEEEDGNEAARRVARELRELEEKQKKAARDAKDLALERGEKPKPSSNLPSTSKPVTVTIREKKVTKAATEPTPDIAEDGEDHLVLDGYKTKFDPKADQNER
ncbi:hypothetical protein F5B19DRAFT_439633 [Rostrohypoxylon terebratum]|nr:hypothetical protein F5B19DRAFT_439633 [Rostrohypoxylon terebratum]